NTRPAPHGRDRKLLWELPSALAKAVRHAQPAWRKKSCGSGWSSPFEPPVELTAADSPQLPLALMAYDSGHATGFVAFRSSRHSALWSQRTAYPVAVNLKASDLRVFVPAWRNWV